MGGRGSSAGGSIPAENREFEQLPTSVLGVNTIKGYKIIVHQTKINATKPIESNTPNTVYVSADRDGKISSAIFYKDHKIYKEIGIESGMAEIHYWENGYRDKHNNSNRFSVTEKADRDLAAAMIRHNLANFHDEVMQRYKTTLNILEKRIRNIK